MIEKLPELVNADERLVWRPEMSPPVAWKIEKGRLNPTSHRAHQGFGIPKKPPKKETWADGGEEIMKETTGFRRSLGFKGLISIFALAALVLGGTGTGFAAEKEIKVGIDVGLTGGTSAYGKRAWNTYQMIFDEVNAAGGIKSMGGAKIKAMLLDHQSKPDIAGSNAEKLIRDGAAIVMGTNSSDCTMVASQVCQRAKIPFISSSDLDTMIVERGFDYVFRTCPGAYEFAEAALQFSQWAGKKAGKTPQKVAIVVVQTASGMALLKMWENMLPKVYTVVYKESYPQAQQDFTGMVSKMKGLGVEFVFQQAFPSDAVLVTRSYKEMGFNPMGFIGTDAGHDIIMYRENLGKDADYTFCTTQWSSTMKVPKLKETMAKYQARFGIEYQVTDATVGNAASVLIDALERGGSDNPVKLRDALKSTDINVGQYWYFVPDGCKFDAKNQNMKQKPVTTQFFAGKDECVFPEGYASAKAVFPIPPWEKR